MALNICPWLVASCDPDTRDRVQQVRRRQQHRHHVSIAARGVGLRTRRSPIEGHVLRLERAALHALAEALNEPVEAGLVVCLGHTSAD